MIVRRGCFKKTNVLEQPRADELARLHGEAGSPPPGVLPEQASRQARLAETGSPISERLGSGGLCRFSEGARS